MPCSGKGHLSILQAKIRLLWKTRVRRMLNLKVALFSAVVGQTWKLPISRAGLVSSVCLAGVTQ